MPSSLILPNNSEPFLNWIVTCNEKWILYDNQHWPAQWLDWVEAPKYFPKPNLHQKKVMSLFGGLLLVWSTTALWILVKPLHLRSMLSKSMRCTDNFNAFRWYWSTKWAKLFSTTMPNHTLHNQCFKSRMNWAMKFCLIHHIHLTSCQLTTTSSSISTTFCREMPPQVAKCRKCFPRVCQVLRHGFLHCRNKQIYFSLAKMSWL